MYTVKDIATASNVTIWAVYKAHSSGRLPEPIRAGHARIYTESDRERALAYFARSKGSRPVGPALVTDTIQHTTGDKDT